MTCHHPPKCGKRGINLVRARLSVRHPHCWQSPVAGGRRRRCCLGNLPIWVDQNVHSMKYAAHPVDRLVYTVSSRYTLSEDHLKVTKERGRPLDPTSSMLLKATLVIVCPHRILPLGVDKYSVYPHATFLTSHCSLQEGAVAISLD